MLKLKGDEVPGNPDLRPELTALSDEIRRSGDATLRARLAFVGSTFLAGVAAALGIAWLDGVRDLLGLAVIALFGTFCSLWGSVIVALPFAAAFREGRAVRHSRQLAAMDWRDRAEVLLSLRRSVTGDALKIVNRLIEAFDLQFSSTFRKGLRPDLGWMRNQLLGAIETVRAARLGVFVLSGSITIPLLAASFGDPRLLVAVALVLLLTAAVNLTLVPRLNRDGLFLWLSRLPVEQREEVLLPLRSARSSDARRVIDPLIRELEVRTPREMVPAASPGGEGAEVTPAPAAPR